MQKKKKRSYRNLVQPWRIIYPEYTPKYIVFATSTLNFYAEYLINKHRVGGSKSRKFTSPVSVLLRRDASNGSSEKRER